MLTHTIMSPKHTTPGVERLLNLIGSSHQPVQVPVALDGSAGPSELFQCYLVVRDRVRLDGGTMVCGWLIAETNIMYQAQHHAVWSPPDAPDELICVTPKVIFQNDIMFVRDDRYAYKDRDIPNYRVSEPVDSIVEDLIIVQRTRDVLEAQFEYKSDNEQIIPAKFVPIITMLYSLEQEWLRFISADGKQTSPCFCGKNLAYRDCHGFDMTGKARSLLKQHGLALDWMPSE